MSFKEFSFDEPTSPDTDFTLLANSVAEAAAVPEEPSAWFIREVLVHEDALRAYLRSSFSSICDVDDIVQEAYVRLMRARLMQMITRPKAFLFAIARNAAWDLLRHRPRSISLEMLCEQSQPLQLADATDIPETVSRRQEFHLLACAIDALPRRCRMVIALRIEHGLSTKEIARKLSVSRHTVKHQISRGTRGCADFFAQRGLIPDSRSGHPVATRRNLS